ncbi:GATA-binding protein, other eukaryote [Exophiala aquamarina CBS 119918]|uniref:GATA-binding protein, other eukaryote n=1 Tax=Exophiala aquamarina CBS 119918 TaxID=1182545 RepID=A0A072PDZ4_9EURO|nr:GATA-binding protein, other eukaryote [Exophiala aquamarina CBS 119918]KEF58279.1 GATA-binding protein, other eukaryote [Exophiala aquamarina CBS 119918]
MAASLPGADHNLPFTQPVCQNCQTSTTPLWRRDEAGSVLCNACGLFLKLHGRPRPISLKTDVIKSRNRVKTANQGPKKKYKHPDLSKFDQNGLPASQSEMVSPPNGINPHRRVSQMAASVTSDRSHSPVSRTGTPGALHDPNIAPQHLFDGAAINDPHFNGSPSLPAMHFNHPSPGAISLGGDRHLEAPMSYEQLVVANTNLRTRVSELEVINMVYSDNENSLRAERDRAVKERDELKRKFEELEKRIQELNDPEQPTKRQRLSNEPQD